MPLLEGGLQYLLPEVEIAQSTRTVLYTFSRFCANMQPQASRLMSAARMASNTHILDQLSCTDDCKSDLVVVRYPAAHQGTLLLALLVCIDGCTRHGYVTPKLQSADAAVLHSRLVNFICGCVCCRSNANGAPRCCATTAARKAHAPLPAGCCHQLRPASGPGGMPEPIWMRQMRCDCI